MTGRRQGGPDPPKKHPLGSAAGDNESADESIFSGLNPEPRRDIAKRHRDGAAKFRRPDIRRGTRTKIAALIARRCAAGGTIIDRGTARLRQLGLGKTALVRQGSEHRIDVIAPGAEAARVIARKTKGIAGEGRPAVTGSV